MPDKNDRPVSILGWEGNDPVSSIEVLTLRIEQLSGEMSEIKEQIKAQRAETQAIKIAAVEREKAQLKWGIGALGSVVMALLTIVWAFRKNIFGA